MVFYRGLAQEKKSKKIFLDVIFDGTWFDLFQAKIRFLEELQDVCKIERKDITEFEWHLGFENDILRVAGALPPVARRTFWHDVATKGFSIVS